MWQLKDYRRIPPGGFYYEQTEGIKRGFQPRPVINDLAKAVSRFRTGNNLPRPTLAESLKDIDAYTCVRLGNNPAWCFETELTHEQVHKENPILMPPCTSCGAKVE